MKFAGGQACGRAGVAGRLVAELQNCLIRSVKRSGILGLAFGHTENPSSAKHSG